MKFRLPVVASVAVFSLTACASQQDAPETSGSWVGTMTTEGNVTTVVNGSGSVWGGTATLVEEASIGVEAGDDPYMFGRIEGLAASENRIYVSDSQVPALRAYDWNGRHLHDFGRQGQGPGEFESVRSIGVDGNGRVWVDDMRGGRILVYSLDGEQVATIRKVPPPFSGSSPPIVVTPDGHGWSFAFEVTDSPRARRFLIPYALDGTTGEAVELPEFETAPTLMAVGDGGRRFLPLPFYPRGTFAFSPAPAILRGSPDRYWFRIEYLDGSVVVIERRDALVEVAAGEAAAHEHAVTAFLRLSDPQWSWPAEPIPTTKPAYIDLVPATSGEVWVARPGPAHPIPDCDEGEFEPDSEVHCWVEQRMFDVFDSDGHCLGEVLLPDEIVLRVRPYIRDRDVIALAEDDAGTIMVKRYRLVLPGGQ